MSFSVEVQWNLSVCCSYRLQEEAELSEHLVRCIKRFSSAAKLEASAHASNVLCLQMVTACYNTDAETVREDCGPAKFWTTQQALMSVFGSFCTIVFFVFVFFFCLRQNDELKPLKPLFCWGKYMYLYLLKCSTMFTGYLVAVSICCWMQNM